MDTTGPDCSESGGIGKSGMKPKLTLVHSEPMVKVTQEEPAQNTSLLMNWGYKYVTERVRHRLRIIPQPFDAFTTQPGSSMVSSDLYFEDIDNGEEVHITVSMASMDKLKELIPTIASRLTKD